jgi:hypothetical protein
MKPSAAITTDSAPNAATRRLPCGTRANCAARKTAPTSAQSAAFHAQASGSWWSGSARRNGTAIAPAASLAETPGRVIEG